MKLAILGGGGFRVPLVHGALLRDGGVTDLVLHDVDAGRLAAIERVLAEQAAGVAGAPRVRVATDLADALSDVDFVFSAIRVGGLRGRRLDEQLAHAEGVLGQETVGAGGIAYGLRTIPVAVELARLIGELAPRAWVINFTNPAGMVTEAMAAHLGGRVLGICDSPVGLCRRVAGALGIDPATAWFDYAGLNHLGWLRAVRVGGEDVLPRLLADPGALESFEEGKLFGASWLRALGAVPNEYLHYYYFAREAASSSASRGALLLEQQRDFYAEPSLAAWDRTRLEREATYMAETREGERDDLEGGGYENVALALMRAIAFGERTNLILNVRNGSALPDVPPDAVVEVPCVVDANGARPLAVSPLPGHALGLVTAIKAVERATIEAATTGSREAALRAFALHPLIDSVSVARRLLDAYAAAHPELSYLA
ncbi:6-phospho-beta-glucosidase [Amycolatopsis lexingtonensis]|uniref:6-phospho-beta-glucosidase n=1 Tax=Amycolatopsis lexingtonensis TaxID=218822 RepID=A0ABR9I504_9PSEU|nr:6-phospho-beta-glucosidase [Amycolatopsis lexingtonensis]MBE1498278.1 6-phospho-beta-glucosidase [Amycolatopsis lexingtonensis]